ncbi:hypothetical protein J4734_13850 [Klebsiella pneumoniae]|uniref:Uncharacterized protein n=1 Tax=Klebsiella pneumoniae TaxID=573 RepID=A0A939NN34_KLEPN|nr:hypothetical protein [Klebsiella pneumoniae]
MALRLSGPASHPQAHVSRPGKQQRRRAIYRTPCWSCCRAAASPDPARRTRASGNIRTATAYPPVEYRSRASRLPAS